MEKKYVVKYQVVTGSIDEVGIFEDSVNKLLSENWMAQGGISVSVDEDGKEWIYQAVTRTEEVA